MNTNDKYDLTPAEIVETDITPIEALERANIDIQIATAKKYPRSLVRVKRDMLDMATLDQETAAGCFYTLPARKGAENKKRIQGPSVRLAEIAVSNYGNIKAGARIISDDGKFITAQGVCHDVEKNVSISVEVKRRITDKMGRRYSDDMIQVTCQAACAIAYRNAVFKVVPLALIQPVYEKAKECAIGTAKTLTERRAKAIEAFSKHGIEEPRILQALEKTSVEEITLADVETLLGYFNAIKDGEVSIDEVFPPVVKTPKLFVSTKEEEKPDSEQEQPEQEKAE